MAIPLLMSAGARALGGKLVKSQSKKIVSSKIFERKNKTQVGGQQPNVKKSSALVPVTQRGSAITYSSFVSDVETKKKPTISGNKNPYVTIIKELKSIKKILSKSLMRDKKYKKTKIKILERQKREAKESKSEAKKNNLVGSLAGKLGLTKIKDTIGNFIGNILIGKIVLFLIDNYETIQKVLKFIGGATQFITDLSGKIFDGIVSVISGAYNINDKIREKIEDIGGDRLAGLYDKFTSKFTQVANLTLALMAIGSRLGPKKPERTLRKPPRKPGKAVKPKTTKKLSPFKLEQQRKLLTQQNMLSPTKSKPLGFGARLFKGANILSFGLLGKGTNFVQNVGKSLKTKYDSVTKSIGGAFNKLGKAAKEQLVKRILDPAMVFLNPILDKVKGIGDKILRQIEKIPGFGRVADFLKKQGITNLGDAGKLAKKLGGKAIPILGGILNFLFSYDRLAQGDTIGGLLEAVSGAFDISGLFGFGLGPGISMGIDAYMFARDLIPGIQQGEESIINNLGLGGLKGDIDKMFSKLPDLSTIVKKITGSPEDQSLMKTIGSAITGITGIGGQEQSRATSGTPEQRAMLDSISMAEGTKTYGTIYGGKVVPELERGELTIGQVLQMQKTGRLNGRNVGYARDQYDSDATGRYQFMSYVLKEEMQKQGISPNTLFTPELQDKMILARIARMRGVTAGMLAKEGMSANVIDRLAPEFASFPNLMGDVRYGYGTSYYGQGGKSAQAIKDAFTKSLQGQTPINPSDSKDINLSSWMGTNDSKLNNNLDTRASYEQEGLQVLTLVQPIHIVKKEYAPSNSILFPNLYQ